MNYIFLICFKNIAKVCINELLNEKMLNKSLIFLKEYLTLFYDILAYFEIVKIILKIVDDVAKILYKI